MRPADQVRALDVTEQEEAAGLRVQRKEQAKRQGHQTGRAQAGDGGTDQAQRGRAKVTENEHVVERGVHDQARRGYRERRAGTSQGRNKVLKMMDQEIGKQRPLQHPSEAAGGLGQFRILAEPVRIASQFHRISQAGAAKISAA